MIPDCLSRGLARVVDRVKQLLSTVPAAFRYHGGVRLVHDQAEKFTMLYIAKIS